MMLVLLVVLIDDGEGGSDTNDVAEVVSILM